MTSHDPLSLVFGLVWSRPAEQSGDETRQPPQDAITDGVRWTAARRSSLESVESVGQLVGLAVQRCGGILG